MTEEHIAAALGRVPALIEALCDNDEPRMTRLLSDIPIEHAGYVIGYLLSALLETAVFAHGGDEDAAKAALRNAVRAGLAQDQMESTVRAILHDAAGDEGLS